MLEISFCAVGTKRIDHILLFVYTSYLSFCSRGKRFALYHEHKTVVYSSRLTSAYHSRCFAYKSTCQAKPYFTGKRFAFEPLMYCWSYRLLFMVDAFSKQENLDFMRLSYGLSNDAPSTIRQSKSSLFWTSTRCVVYIDRHALVKALYWRCWTSSTTFRRQTST